MRQTKNSAILSLGFTRAGSILFKPFSLKKWMKLAFVALFAGALSMGNGGGGSGPAGKADEPVGDKTAATVSQTAVSEEAGERTVPAQGRDAGMSAEAPVSNTAVPAWVWVIGGVAAFLFAGLMILMTWIQAHFSFIWFEAYATNRLSVSGSYHRHRAAGNSLFRWNLLLSMTFFVLLGGVFFWCWLAAQSSGMFKPGYEWSIGAVWNVFGAQILLVIILMLPLLILNAVSAHFAVPIMALDERPFLPALRISFRALGHSKDAFVFFGSLLLYTFLGGIFNFVLIIMVLLAFVLAGAVLFGGAYLLLGVAMKLNTVFIVLCVVAGVPFFVAMMLAMIMAQLPATVGKYCYSLEYLLALEGGCDRASLERHAQRELERGQKSPLWAPIFMLVLGALLTIVLLLAAIAVPNFQKARLAAQQAAQTK
jgi:hypothetical protein